ncbi:LacI family DNA-binding transcriptional regulator [Pseudoduganella namucuonensis]|uniref:LacI family transcriptional regulator n=1 Tax=Pseudoduganella namucuonensis TaxID=1035707 RepID=A0A1I7M101_9BURK|nr:LacI family DNA-binding transcriptional regulator [Pseudoduganella namucuonensis]SFV15618.1 LacI family transcriptional regulator [Pseudoduganella namucuonensis]
MSTSQVEASPMGDTRGAPSMADVAKLAGVSPMTVSRVLNGRDTVRPSTRKKVAEAIAALNYAPNQEARTLTGAKPIQVGFLYSKPSGGYLAEFLLGLLAQASLDNVQLLVECCHLGQPAEEQTRRLIAQGLDGIILPAPLCDDAAIVDRIVAAGVPLVVVASGKPDSRLSAVSIDDRRAAYDMTRHLMELGHERIGFITGHPNQSVTAPRLAGYQDALREGGVEPAAELVAPGLFNYRSGLDAAEALLGLAQRPTAIFASNDDMAAATVAVAHKLGIDVPGDLTVAGFDDTALATTIWPALTTVRQPIGEMAAAAVQCLVRRVQAERSRQAGQVEHIVIDFSLIRRQSDAAPRVRPPSRPPSQVQL